MMDRATVLSQGRLAGMVKRYHAWPMLTQQSVAEHSWQCMRIWHSLWGVMPVSVANFFLWHDAGELVTGDAPFPVKRNAPKLKTIYDEMEEDAVKAMDGDWVILAEPNKSRVKCCDLLEMFETGLHERALGNQFATPIIDDTYKAIIDLSLPDEDFKLVMNHLFKLEKIYGRRNTQD
jgi:5'-deoxynucleotidase YfbR-like HD superfamily hydrolase